MRQTIILIGTRETFPWKRSIGVRSASRYISHSTVDEARDYVEFRKRHGAEKIVLETWCSPPDALDAFL